MSDQRRIEKARTEREALDAATTRPPGSGEAVRAALKRYLASESYREKAQPAKKKATEPEE